MRAKIIKCRVNWNCGLCKTKINKGCYCLKDSWVYICLDCAENYINFYILKIQKQQKVAEDLKVKIKENYDRYIKNNMVCGLEG